MALRAWFDGKPPILTSKNQRGTMYDQCMLDALAIPAYLVTSDGPFRMRVRASGSFQAAWMMAPDAFVTRCTRGELPPLVFPDRSGG